MDIPHDFLAVAAGATPDAPALIAAGQTWTYRTMTDEVEALCGALAAHGILPGAHVAALMSNSPACVLLIHALARLRAVIVPLNTRLTAPELRYQVTKARVTRVIHDAAHATAAALGVTAIDIDTLMAQRPPGGLPAGPHADDGSAPHAIVFTSGTSGRPKGAVISFAAQFASATASAFRLGVLPTDRWLLVLPLFHVGGLAVVMRSALYGTAIHLLDGFQVETVNHVLDHEPVTLVSLVPTMLYRLLEARGDRPLPPSLRLVLLGGAAATPELAARCLALGVPIAPTYGLTEANSQVATLTPDAARSKPGSVGKALPLTTVSVLREDGTPAAVDEYGEIVVRGPTLMTGYYDDPEASARTLRGGALYTGDIGRLDADGDLWVIQRRSDLIVTGGENVYPAEVEAVLRQHPAVQEAAVVGVAHPEWGQQVAAAVVLRAGQQASAETLAQFARERLAGYKLPRQWRFIEALPVTGSGKIQRAAVVDLFGVP